MPSARPKKYICQEPDCGKAYNRPSLLRQHERTHTNERPFVCSEHGCGKGFFRKAHLETHMLSHLCNENKPFQCPVCGKGMTSSQRLKRHEVIHTKSFKCTFKDCQKAFYVWQSLRHHIDMDHKRIRTCEHCNRNFQKLSDLSRHKLKYHGDVSLFACRHPGCFEAFKDKVSLETHTQEVHPSLRCPRCDKVCIGAEAMETHLQIHTKHHGSISQASVEIPDPVSQINEYQSVQTMLRDGVLEMKDLEASDEEDISVSSSEDATPIKTSGGRSDTSIIKVMKNRDHKTYVCPRRNCHKVYVRLHAYEKHLERHRLEVLKAEETLRRLRREEGGLSEEEETVSGNESGHASDQFSDLSDFERDEDSETPNGGGQEEDGEMLSGGKENEAGETESENVSQRGKEDEISDDKEKERNGNAGDKENEMNGNAGDKEEEENGNGHEESGNGKETKAQEEKM